MSEARVVACANCGARYRIPESFKASKSRCKGCGATIEIASSIVSDSLQNTESVQEIVLHSKADHKSIRMNQDGSFQEQWNRGGRSTPPGKV